jgi:hypothetical protein
MNECYISLKYYNLLRKFIEDFLSETTLFYFKKKKEDNNLI